MLRLEGVDAFYGDLQALFGVSFEVRDKEIVALVGANAAGKTTSIRVVSGLVRPGGGRVLFDGADLASVAAHRTRLCWDDFSDDEEFESDPIRDLALDWEPPAVQIPDH